MHGTSSFDGTNFEIMRWNILEEIWRCIYLHVLSRGFFCRLLNAESYLQHAR